MKKNNTEYLVVILCSMLFTSLAQGQCISGDCENGFGKYQYKSGNTFEGTFKASKKQNGTFTYTTGDKYVGNYANDKRHGQGIFHYKSGNRFEGEFLEGEKHYGTFYYQNGNIYVGYFKDNKRNGKGAMYLPDQRIFKGTWKDDKLSKSDLSTGDFQIYAVIVGVAEHANPNNSLNYTDDDAQKFYDFLVSPSGGLVSPSNIALLLNRNATKANIIQALQQTFSKATSKDEVIFYFSGHGGKGLFVPYDAGWGNYLYHTEVKQAFKNCKAKFKFCIADACHAASIRTKSTQNKTTEMDTIQPKTTDFKTYYPKLKSPRSGVAVLMSSRASESSIEFGSLQQGVFSYYLVKGLDGEADSNHNNLVSIGELFDYIYKNVLNYTGDRQHPVLFGQFEVTMPVSSVYD